MGSIPLLLKNCLHFLLGFLLLQFGQALPPDNQQVSPFQKQTTPPAQFLKFADDYASLDKARFMEWIHPRRGLVNNGILLTKDEADADFQNRMDALTGTQGLNIRFNYGDFYGANTYQADAWEEIKGREQRTGQVKWFTFHYIYVFEIIDGVWYMVQSEFVAPDPGTMPLTSDSGQGTTSAVLPGVTPWPLLIGTNYVQEEQLRPIKGTMADGKTWTLGIAVTEKKPTVLYFFSVDQQLSMAPKEELQAQMDFLSGLYDTFGHDSLYIFGVTDEPKDELDWLGQAGYNKFAPLLDDGSNLHAALNIDLHPFIVVFDSAGTVIATCKTYRPGSYDLIEGRIRDAVASAKTTH